MEKIPPTSARKRPTSKVIPKACCSVLANDVRNTPMPHIAAVARSPSTGRRAGCPSRRRTYVVTAQITKMVARPVRKIASSLPRTIWVAAPGRRDPGERAGRPLHQQGAHTETAPDEEEDDRDVGREEVQVDLAAVTHVLTVDLHRRRFRISRQRRHRLVVRHPARVHDARDPAPRRTRRTPARAASAWSRCRTRECGSHRGSTIGMSRVCRLSCDGRTATPPSRVPFATASLTDC